MQLSCHVYAMCCPSPASCVHDAWLREGRVGVNLWFRMPTPPLSRVSLSSGEGGGAASSTEVRAAGAPTVRTREATTQTNEDVSLAALRVLRPTGILLTSGGYPILRASQSATVLEVVLIEGGFLQIAILVQDHVLGIPVVVRTVAVADSAAARR